MLGNMTVVESQDSKDTSSRSLFHFLPYQLNRYFLYNLTYCGNDIIAFDYRNRVLSETRLRMALPYIT